MKSDRLTELLIFERRTDVKGEFAETVPTWTEFARAWAEITERSTATKDMADNRTVTITEFAMNARYTPGVTLADRVAYGGDTFAIIALAEIGRRDGLEIRLRREGK